MATRSVTRHNEAILQDLKKGDLVEFPRELYSHWGVYVGNDDIVHFTGNRADNIGPCSFSGQIFEQAIVKREKFLKVADQSKAVINNYYDDKLQPQPAEEIVRIATSMVGQNIGYNMIWYNCEHFATMCRYCIKISEQSDNAVQFATTLGVAGVIPLPGVTIASLAYMLCPDMKTKL